MGLLDSVYKVFSRKDEDTAKPKLRNSDFGRPIDNPISLRDLEVVNLDGSKTPSRSSKRSHGKGSPRILRTPTTIDILRKRRLHMSPKKASMSEPAKKVNNRPLVKSANKEVLDAYTNDESSSSRMTIDTPLKPLDDGRSPHRYLSSSQTCPSTVSLSNTGDLLHSKTVTEKLQDALTDARDQGLSHKPLETTQTNIHEHRRDITSDYKDEQIPLKIVSDGLLQFPLEYEKFLEQKFAIQQQSANFPLNKEMNQGEDHRPDLAPQESPHLSKIRQEDSPRQRKHHKAAESQSILNKEYQNVSASLVKELKVIPLVENEPMEENASHAKTMFHGSKDTKSSQPHRHKKVTSKGKHKKISPKRQKKVSIIPGAIDLSIFDLDDESSLKMAKSVEPPAKSKFKQKETIAQKIKRLNKARKAAKKEARRHTKEKGAESTEAESRSLSNESGSASLGSPHEVLRGNKQQVMNSCGKVDKEYGGIASNELSLNQAMRVESQEPTSPQNTFLNTVDKMRSPTKLAKHEQSNKSDAEGLDKITDSDLNVAETADTEPHEGFIVDATSLLSPKKHSIDNGSQLVVSDKQNQIALLTTEQQQKENTCHISAREKESTQNTEKVKHDVMSVVEPSMAISSSGVGENNTNTLVEASMASNNECNNFVDSLLKTHPADAETRVNISNARGQPNPTRLGGGHDSPNDSDRL